MSKDLDRLRELVGTGAPKSTKNITGNMYELRDMLNEATQALDPRKEKLFSLLKDKFPQFQAGKIAHVNKVAKHLEQNGFSNRGAMNAALDFEDFMKVQTEAAKPDFADIDGDGDKEEDMKDAAKDKEKTDEAVELEEGEKPDFLKKDDEEDEDDKDKTDESYDHLDEMSKFIKMAEWANSPGNQYEDRGHYSEQPEGETVDLSLRRYLDAEAHPVKVVEDHTEDSMLKEYKEFKDE